MIEFTQVIKDESGTEIKVGSKVRYWDSFDAKIGPIGEVVEITDFEGDVDDDTGRSILNKPDVNVKYPDGSIETYATSEWENTEGGWHTDANGDPEPGWNHSEGKCEELIAIKEESLNESG